MFDLSDEISKPTVKTEAARRPVFARHAASLILWRPGASGIEVLMGVRGAGHRFMPNRLVFPGGAVDPGDRRARAAVEPSEHTLAMLQRTAQRPLARAIVMAAARELEEEVGLSFGSPPALDRIGYLCRAVTPTQSPIRFNARFLVAPADAVAGAVSDTRELEHVRFYAVSEAVEMGLMGVTRDVLLRLGPYLAQGDAELAEKRALYVYKQRIWVNERG